MCSCYLTLFQVVYAIQFGSIAFAMEEEVSGETCFSRLPRRARFACNARIKGSGNLPASLNNQVWGTANAHIVIRSDKGPVIKH